MAGEGGLTGYCQPVAAGMLIGSARCSTDAQETSPLNVTL
jgi:hypothetical protein